MKTLYYILFLSAIVTVFLLWMTADARAEWSPRWYLYLDVPVKESPTTCDGEIIVQADRFLSRGGWLERAWMLEPFIPQPGTMRRIVPGDTLTVKVEVWNFAHKFIYHTQGLYERLDGTRYWVADAECDTLWCTVWQGHAWFPFVRGNQYQILVPVEGLER